MPEPSHSRLHFRCPWMIFWAAFGVRVALILIGRTYRMPALMNHFSYGWEVGRIARSLVEGHGYANPFNGPSGPTAWIAPLYPLLMAAGFKMFGIYTKAAAAFVLICNSAFAAGTVIAVYEIAARCFDAEGIARRGSRLAAPVAMWSAWIWALYPGVIQYATRWLWETSLSTFLFTWTVVFALRLRGVGEGEGGRQARPGEWVGFGAIWGLVALSNPSLLLCLPFMMAWVVWPEVHGGRLRLRTFGGVVLTSAAFAVVLAPWVIRNERVLHAFVPTRSNMGVELYESTLPRNDAFPWGPSLPMWAGDPEFREFVRMGEVGFAKMRAREAMERIRARPGIFVRHAVDRFFFFWDDTPHETEHVVGEYLRRLQYCFVSLCGLMGLGLMFWTRGQRTPAGDPERRRVEGAGLMALCFVLIPIPYYLVTVQARFRHPLEPLIAVLAVYLFRSVGASSPDGLGAGKKLYASEKGLA